MWCLRRWSIGGRLCLHADIAGDAIFVPAPKFTALSIHRSTGAALSFQFPTRYALYRGERDHPNDSPKPEWGTEAWYNDFSGKAGPVFGKSGDWRSGCFAGERGVNIVLDYVQLMPAKRSHMNPLAQNQFMC